MGRGIVRRTADRGGREAHNLYIAAEATADDTHKWVRERRWDGAAYRRH